MKVTTTRILDKKPIFGQGTGKHQGCEVYPTTPTLLKRIKMSVPEQMILVSNQHKTLDKLPDYKSINNLQIPINNIFEQHLILSYFQSYELKKTFCNSVCLISSQSQKAFS